MNTDAFTSLLQAAGLPRPEQEYRKYSEAALRG
jgi:hypothetical protein